MMMIGRCSKGQHHIAGEDEHWTNERTNKTRLWDGKKTLVLALISVLVRTRERFLYICEAKEKRQDLERYFPWGKEGITKRSLSSTIDDDGCAVASRHVTTRTAPRAAFFLLPLFSLSLSISLLVFCFFHSPSFLYLVVRTSQSRKSVSRDTLLCVT